MVQRADHAVEHMIHTPELPGPLHGNNVLGLCHHANDILARERGIDDLYWDKIDELTLFDYLNFDKILGMVVKMMIIRRWLILDEATGREMFKKLVDEVRGTFKGVEYNE